MQLNVGVRAKHARKPFCNTAIRNQQLLLNHIAQLLSCSQASKLSLSGLLHVVQAL
jgi:hypothetical protein